MNTTICPDCGTELYFGDFPFCPHGSTIHRDALQFQSIAVHRKLLPSGEYIYSYPPTADTPPDPGYESISLNSLAEADRFCKDRSREESEIKREQQKGEAEYWESRKEARRARADQLMQEQFGRGPSAVVRRIRDLIDQRRKAKRPSSSIEFHNKAISFDSSHIAPFKDDSKKKVSVVVQGFRR